jgi:hypothetical protein
VLYPLHAKQAEERDGETSAIQSDSANAVAAGVRLLLELIAPADRGLVCLMSCLRIRRPSLGSHVAGDQNGNMQQPLVSLRFYWRRIVASWSRHLGVTCIECLEEKK